MTFLSGSSSTIIAYPQSAEFNLFRTPLEGALNTFVAQGQVQTAAACGKAELDGPAPPTPGLEGPAPPTSSTFIVLHSGRNLLHLRDLRTVGFRNFPLKKCCNLSEKSIIRSAKKRLH